MNAYIKPRTPILLFSIFSFHGE